MNSSLLRLAALFLLLGSLAGAAPDATDFTAKELAQGYRDSVVLAKPRATHRATVDAAETGEGLRLRQRFDRFGDLRVLQLTATDTVAEAVTRLRATGRYEFVEPDRIIHGTTAPNDTLYANQQWSMNNTGSNGPGGGTAGADIRAETGWATLTSAGSVIVAVVDSGARLTHEDLAANLWNSSTSTHGASYVSGNGSQTDTNPNDTEVSHGSHVSGIIGAVGNNGKGVAGVAWDVKLMELRFLHGTTGSGSTSDSVAAINFAIANGAKIINASYGSDQYSSSEFTAINAARAADIIFVAAAGNDTLNVDNGTAYPAGYALDNIVAVAATTNTDALASYSNYGAGSVDIAAPGSSITSCGIASDSEYTVKSGTSMATPHVSGVLALMRNRFPAESYRQIINRLLRSVTPLSALAGKVQSAGRLNLASALASTDNRPFNDDFATRANLGTAPNIHIRANNVGSTSEGSEPAHAGIAAANTLWWTWTAPSSTSVTFNTSGSAYDTTLAIYTGTVLGSLTPIASNDDDTVHAKTTSLVTLNVTAGVTYQIAVGRKSGTAGLTLLSIGTVPANDDFANAQTLTGASFSVSATTLNASRETGETDPTAPTNYSAGHTVWYKWVAPSSGTYALYAYSPLVDMLAGVYTGSAVGSLTKVAWNDDAATQITSGTYAGAVNSNSLVRFSATAGTTYYFQVDTTNVNPAGGDFTLTLTTAAWQFAAYGGIVSSPAVSSTGTIYFGAGTTITDTTLDSGSYPENNVYALNADGTQKWKFTTGSPVDLASPAIGNDGNIYVGSGDKKLYALNATTGAQKWSYTAGTAILSSPAIATDGTIYFRDDTLLYALTSGTSSATLKWSFSLSGSTYSSPAVAADGTVYVGATGGYLYAVNPSGSQKWRFTTNGDVYTSAAIAADGTVYCATLNGYFYAINPDGTQKWVWSVAGSAITSSPVLAPDGTIYFGAYDHKLHALTSAGAEKWSYTMGDEVRAATPAVGADGNVYLPDYDGKVYVVSSTGSLVRTYATGALIRSSPAIANGQLLVGSSDGLMYAFSLDAVNDVAPANSAWPIFQHNLRRDGQYSTTITSSPTSQNVAVGSGITLSVTATGPGTLSYQWLKDGVAIGGATSSSYTISNAQISNSGSYTVRITSTTGATTTSTPAVITVVVASASPGRLINLSVRTGVGTGANALFVGLVVGGTGTSGSKPLLIRAIGPTLADYGVTGVLADPNLDLIPQNATSPLASNDNWGGDAQVRAVAVAVGAFPLTSDTTKDAALYISPSAGVYSVKVTGVNNTTGIALAEIYDATGVAYTTSTPRLINVSARAQVGTGDGVLIAGFVVTGNTSCTVLIRAVGPTLGDYGVTGFLADPLLELTQAVNGNTVPIASNDNWGGNAQITSVGTTVGAFPLGSATSKDAAILVTLPPGVYSAKASGVGGTTGVALIEVYEVP